MNQISCFTCSLNWEILIALAALFTSFIAIYIALISNKNQKLIFILSQLNSRAQELNEIVYQNPDINIQGENELSKIVSIIVSTEQQFNDLFSEFNLKNDLKLSLLNQFYLMIHVKIRCNIWQIQESNLKSQILKKQLESARNFLRNSHEKFD